MTRSSSHSERSLSVEAPFSLSLTCGPVHWTTDRSPRHRWSDGAMTWVGWENDTVVWRRCHQQEATTLVISGSAAASEDAAWASAVLGTGIFLPTYPDAAMEALATASPGLHPFCDGSLFDGIITSIVGQSISVAAAAVTQAKLAALFTSATDIDGAAMRPLPTAAHLADASAELVRSSGVTWKRAEGLIFAAREQVAGNLPSDAFAREAPDDAVKSLLTLPQIGRWTAESTVLWGVGAPNAHPTGDVALLRAARAIYGLPDLTLKSLDPLAEQWQPARGLAARLLWNTFFGPAPT